MKTLKEIMEAFTRAGKNQFQDAAAAKRHASLPHTQDIRTIKAYQDDSVMINKGLIRGNMMGMPMAQKNEKALSHAIKHLSEPTERDMHVYHGFNPNGQQKTKLVVPDLPKNDDGHHVLNNPAYLSTSLSRQSALGFGRHLLKIHVPKGSKVGVAKPDVHYRHEKELILHKGHVLHIHPTPTKVETDEGSYHVWHAKLIHDGTHEH